MAIHAPIMGAPSRAPSKIALDLPQFSAVDLILDLFGRENVELAIETLIERLDAEDGDPDLESNGDHADADGDEQDHGGAEDDFCPHRNAGPGCPVADPGGTSAYFDRTEDDEPDEPAMRRAHTQYIRADLRRRGLA